jgi:F-type H+-transporting ATPase subunit a
VIFIDFNITEHARLFGVIPITDTLISTWIIGAALIALAIVTRVKIKKFTDVPTTGFQNIIEAIVEAFDNFVVSVMTKRYSYFGAWFFGLFLFIMVANISGIFGLRPPTADFAMTFPLALTSVIFIQFMGIRYNMKRGEYLKDLLLRPVFIFAPLNILSELSRSVSLSLRLFGNMVGGLILMGLMYGLFPWFLTIGIPGFLSLYFDIAIGLLHALLFVVLSMYFMMMKAPKEDF